MILKLISCKLRGALDPINNSNNNNNIILSCQNMLYVHINELLFNKKCWQ